MRSTMVSLRISKNLLQQIDDLQEAFANDARLSPSGSTSRTDVMLHLILLGLDQIRKEPVDMGMTTEKAAP